MAKEDQCCKCLGRKISMTLKAMVPIMNRMRSTMTRRLYIFVLISILVLLCATAASAQVSFYTGQAVTPVNVTGGGPQPVQGPIPFAGIRVCGTPLTQTSPCLPLATITDASGNTLSNSIGSNFGQFSA